MEGGIRVKYSELRVELIPERARCLAVRPAQRALVSPGERRALPGPPLSLAAGLYLFAAAPSPTVQ